MEKLDAFDISILRMLQKDASQSVATIAEQVALSTSQCHRRIKRLEQAGLITKYIALLNANKFDLKINAIVMVKLHSESLDDKATFTDFINNNDKILECWTVVGEKYAMMRVLTRDMESFSHFISHELMGLRNIASSETIMMMENLKQTSVLPI